MKRLEDEVEYELKQTGQWGNMHDAAEECLQWIKDQEIKKPLNGMSELVKSLTGTPALAILLGSLLSHPIIQEVLDGLFDVLGGAMDDLSYAVEGLSTQSLETIIFELLGVHGLMEFVWLITFPMAPVFKKLSPEIFVSMFGLLGNRELKVNTLPVVLSIAAPLVQQLFTEDIFAHLGDLESYIEDGLYRYMGREEE